MQNTVKHLLWRAAFGPRTKSLDKWTDLSPAHAWVKLKDESVGAPPYIDVADSAVKGLFMGVGELGKQEKRDMDEADKKQMRRQQREDLRNLNLYWLEEMTHSKAQLREKVALFWHGHFASRNINILYQQQLLHSIRENALGDFGELLRAVSKSAAMIAFLNNQQNKKNSPNENFAREVLELFTMGRGHYSEKDIQEAARAFTGWTFRINGDFEFKKQQHDAGVKSFLGKSGRFDGDDILNIILEQRQTAYYLAEKFYRFFVNENRVPRDRIKNLGDRFFDSGYKIRRLLDDIFTSSWFFDEENIGCNIKSPVSLWVGIRRALPMELIDPESQLTLQRALGQILFYPPNVAGWPGGKSWIDSTSLTLRLRIPQLIADREAVDFRGKDDDDRQMGQGSSRNRRSFSAEIDWESARRPFASVGQDRWTEVLSQYLWQVPGNAFALKKINDRAGKSDDFFKAVFFGAMTAPEYQVC